VLVLTRKVGEAIVINNSITVTILSGPVKVRLGIAAPKEVPVRGLEALRNLINAPARSLEITALPLDPDRDTASRELILFDADGGSSLFMIASLHTAKPNSE
jgi:carbon storage regulator CsrA